jgi:hypothetical protein
MVGLIGAAVGKKEKEKKHIRDRETKVTTRDITSRFKILIRNKKNYGDIQVPHHTSALHIHQLAHHTNF